MDSVVLQNSVMKRTIFVSQYFVHFSGNQKTRNLNLIYFIIDMSVKYPPPPLYPIHVSGCLLDMIPARLNH